MNLNTNLQNTSFVVKKKIFPVFEFFFVRKSFFLIIITGLGKQPSENCYFINHSKLLRTRKGNILFSSYYCNKRKIQMPPIKLPSSSQLPSPQLKSNFRMCLPRLSFGGISFLAKPQPGFCPVTMILH